MQFDPAIRYHCLQCGKSCRQNWDVWVRAELPALVRDGYLEIFTEPLPFESIDGRWRLGRNEGGCIALDSDSRCRIHKGLSYRQKPFQCQQYPVLLVQTPDGVLATGSYTCTAVLQGAGPELSESATEIEAWLQRPFFLTRVGEDLPWVDAKALDQHFLALVEDLGWESALQEVLSALVSGHQSGRTDHPLTWWKNCGGTPLNFKTCLPWLLAALLKPCLQLPDKLAWHQFDNAFLEQGALEVEEFGYDGTVAELLDWASTEPAILPDLNRYRSSLHFRKQHLCCGSVLAGWFMLWAIGPLYRVLNKLRGSHQALERIELNLLGHTDLASKIFPALAEFWLSEQKAP